jgi:hypothetical protein
MNIALLNKSKYIPTNTVIPEESYRLPAGKILLDFFEFFWNDGVD